VRQQISHRHAPFVAAAEFRQIARDWYVELELSTIVEHHRRRARCHHLRQRRDVVHGGRGNDRRQSEAPIGRPVALLPDDRAAPSDDDGGARISAGAQSLLHRVIDEDEAIGIHSHFRRWTTAQASAVSESERGYEEREEHCVRDDRAARSFRKARIGPSAAFGVA
jgi:hypothetical protein